MDRGTIQQIISDARTLVCRHGHRVGPAPIGCRRFYEDPRLRIAICDQDGVDDCFISTPAGGGSGWDSVLLWAAFDATPPQSPILFRPGIWTPYLKYLTYCHSRELLLWRITHWSDTKAAGYAEQQEVCYQHVEKVRTVPPGEIYLATDGCWRPDAGRGGWAFFLRYGTWERIGFGWADNSDAGRMELTAILEGLRCAERLGLLTQSRRITVVTDYQKACQRFSGVGGKRRPKEGWAQASQPVPYAVMLDEIYALLKAATACRVSLPGRFTTPDINRAHHLCRMAAGIMTPEALTAAGMTTAEWNEYWDGTSLTTP
jgi:ribonuclease HI